MPVWQSDGSTNDQLGLIISQPGAATTQLSERFDYQGRPRQGTTTAPTVAVGANAGTGASITAHTGTDSAGNVQITTGTSAAIGTLLTITFAQPFTGTNAPLVQLQAKDAGATALYYANCTNTALTIKTAVAPASSTLMSIDYDVTGGA
jgi:hypothetical protein